MPITPAESRIMDALWAKGPLSSEAIRNVVSEPQGWGEATVRTLISRLLKRKAIRSERRDGRVFYVALVSRADYLMGESQSLLDRLFDGRLTPLVAHFAERGALTPAEAKKIRKLLKKFDGDA